MKACVPGPLLKMRTVFPSPWVKGDNIEGKVKQNSQKMNIDIE
jgi:hypothetical protein